MLTQFTFSPAFARSDGMSVVRFVFPRLGSCSRLAIRRGGRWGWWCGIGESIWTSAGNRAIWYHKIIVERSLTNSDATSWGRPMIAGVIARHWTSRGESIGRFRESNVTRRIQLGVARVLNRPNCCFGEILFFDFVRLIQHLSGW